MSGRSKKAVLALRGARSSAPKSDGHGDARALELRTVLDFLRKGDVLMVTRIDRLVLSIGDLQEIGRGIKTKGASLPATEQLIGNGTAAGKCILDVLDLCRV